MNTKDSVSQFSNPIVRGKTAILRVTSLGEIYKSEPASWLVEGLILNDAVTMLNAYAKEGKTYLTMEIARCVATGEPLFRFLETKQGTVLVIDSENSWPLLKGRYEKLGVSEELPIKYLSFQPVRLDTRSGIEALKEAVRDINPALIIFDTLTRFHRKKENEAGEMAIVMETQKELAEAGHSVLTLHHRRKGEGREEEMVRGSGDILASVDNLLTLKKDGNTFVLSFTTGRLNGLQKPIRYTIEEEEEQITLQYQGEVLSREDEILKALRQVLENGEMGVRDIYEKINSNGLTVGEKRLRATLKKYEGKEFKVNKSRHNKTLYGIK